MAGGQGREWALWSKQNPHYHSIPTHSVSGGNDSASSVNSTAKASGQFQRPVSSITNSRTLILALEVTLVTMKASGEEVGKA